MDDSQINGTVIIAVLSYCFIYVFISSFFEHKRIHFIHETGIAIAIGVLIGLIVYFAFHPRLNSLIAFNDKIVFYIILPPMLFSEAFNLKKRRFFQNIFYINIYGIIGTLFNFLTIAAFMYLVNHYGLIRDFENIEKIRNIQVAQLLLFAAAMCSIDDVAALSTIKPQVYPKLYSIIFGESLLKDVITLVLFSSISNFIVNTKGAYDFDFIWYDSFEVLGDFLLTVLVSILIGIAFSIFQILLFKKCRFIIHTNGVTEVGLTFLIGVIAYLTSQTLGYSGIVSMIVTGIMLSHFNIYNMSKNGVQSSKLTFKTISIVSEGILFLLIGLASWQFQSDQQQSTVSWTFIIFGVISVLLGRFVNIAITTLLFYFCVGKDKWRLNIYDLQIIAISGIVRGAIPFALISTVTPIAGATKQTIVNIAMLKSTVIFIVFVSSLLFNGMIPMFIKLRTKVIKQKIQHDHISNLDTLKQQQKRAHQRQLRGERQQQKYKGITQKYWRKLQQGFIKPLLIFNYKGRRDQIKLQKKKQRFQQFGLTLEQQNLEPFLQSKIIETIGDQLKQNDSNKSHQHQISNSIQIQQLQDQQNDKFNN